jgi:hypothetical protein
MPWGRHFSSRLTGSKSTQKAERDPLLLVKAIEATITDGFRSDQVGVE